MGEYRFIREKLEKRKNHFRNLKLSRKMILAYLIFTSAACVIAVFALQLSFRIYDTKLYEKSQQELDFFMQNVNDSLDDVEQVSLQIAMDTQVQESMKLMNSMEYLSAEQSVERQNLRAILLNEINSHSEIKNVIYTDRNQVTSVVGTDCGEIESDIYKQLLEQFEERRGGYSYISPSVEYPYMLSGRDVLSKENASLDYLGTLIFTTDIQEIIVDKREELETSHAMLFVYNESGMIYTEEEEDSIMSEEISLPSLEKEQGYQIIRYQGERYFMCYQKSVKNGWMYVNFFPYSEIFGQIVRLRYTMLLGFAVLFFIILLAMQKVADIVTRPLEQLTESMKIVEGGNFSEARNVLKIEERKDETGQLAAEFDVMLDQIEKLIYENYEKQIILQDTRYKMLQAQINPHFLYNTLNALNWLVKGGRNQEASGMIIELGKLLRASFAKDPYTTVADEVEIAKSYIAIQKIRYSSRIEFEVHAEGELEKYKIPRMILQPLIENSIHYGADQSLECCRIEVFVEEKEQKIVLQVIDSGPGMTEEELESVRNLTYEPKGNGIGLKNIRERLRLTYEESLFEIESQSGKGTKVTLIIPKKENTDV